MDKDTTLKLASALDHWATQMDMGRKPDPKSLTRKASAELRRLQAELDAIKQARSAHVQEPTYTTGHCKEKAQPGGCQLHNLHCGYPACDRKAANTLPEAQQEHEPENEPHVSLASVQEPYGYVWFTKHMEHRFTKMKPHPDMGAMDIRPVYTTPPTAQPAVPEGWKLVPIEPTDAMVDAYDQAQYNDDVRIEATNVWTSMVDAVSPVRKGV